MILSINGAEKELPISRSRIIRGIKSLRSTGPNSFCALTNVDGGFIQAAGGPFLFVLERKLSEGSMYRAVQSNGSIVPFPDGTELRFSGSVLRMRSLEWINRDQVITEFLRFYEESDSTDLKWRSYDPEAIDEVTHAPP